jgi:signal transduction histidine kinase
MVARRPWPLTVLTTLVAGLLTLAVVGVPSIAFAYRSAPLHVAFEVAAALIALLAAYLVYGRFRDSRRADDLALVCGLAVTAASNLFFAALPAALPTLEPDPFATWAAVAGRLAGATLIAISAFAPRRLLDRPRLDARLALFASAALIVAIALVVAALEPRLPIGIDPALSPEGPSVPTLAGHAAVHAVQLVALALFAVAAIGFTRRAQTGERELDRWLAPACVLGAFARAHYFLFPSLYSEWVYTGDVFRFGFYLLLLSGAAREIGAFQRLARDARVFDERRRLARDLHDGLAQELGFIVMHSRSQMQRENGRPDLEPIAVAAERAVDEARRAIAALTRPIDEPLDIAVAQAVEDVAHRSGTRLRLQLAEEVHVEPAMREELVRIVREAVANAVRHGRTDVVTVELVAGDQVRLRISDDGIGFDPLKTRIRGHGLTGMRERAHALGGELRIESSEEGGTAIEVVVPHNR